MSIFNTEGKLYKGITWIGNIFFLNLCWILFSLPIITIGASTVAAHAMMFKIMENKEGYLFKGFVKEFKANFKQGTVLWLITAVAGYGIYIDLQFMFNDNFDPSVFFMIFSIVGIVLVVCSLIYAYPLSARYQNKFFMQIKNSFLLATMHPVKTLILLVIIAVEIAGMMWNTVTMILVILIGPMLLIATVAGFAKRIFDVNDARNAEIGIKPTYVNPDDERDAEEAKSLKENKYSETEILDSSKINDKQ